MIPIVACSIEKTNPILVLQKSVEVYSPETKLIIHRVKPSSFGESMNEALVEAFKIYDEVIISNDDIVINPNTIPFLLEDLEKLKTEPNIKIGFIATLVDNARRTQTIRCPMIQDDYVRQGKWVSEGLIKCVPVVAPVFAYMSKEAFETAQFPNISWFSDDIICEDLTRAGFMHFVSRAYVHHVGSSTIGIGYDKLSSDAFEWVKVNRPEYYDMLKERSK